jgi:non-ribosomal peptide synthetase component F
VPIGRPIANTAVYLLDRGMNPVPQFVSGELYIGGVGLSRGYLGRPGRTAEAFLPNPFGPPGGRIYRSGDQARHRRDGAIEYLGRRNHQVVVATAGHDGPIQPGELRQHLASTLTPRTPRGSPRGRR